MKEEGIMTTTNGTYLRISTMYVRGYLQRSENGRVVTIVEMFYGRHHDLVKRYGMYMSNMTTDMFR
jgi:hypothetical protein